MLDQLSDNGFDVVAIGKIYDIFAGRGITEAVSYTHLDVYKRQIQGRSQASKQGIL